MNMTLLQTVAEAVGLDASQGAFLHRSHRGHWEVHGRLHLTRRHGTTTAYVAFLPWEGKADAYCGRLDDTHNGLHYVPALKGVEDPDRALEIIAAHMKVGVAGSVNTINFDRVALWKAEMKAYNALDLRTAHIVLGGETVAIPPTVIEEWRFMGLNNVDLMEFWDGSSDRLGLQPGATIVDTMLHDAIQLVGERNEARKQLAEARAVARHLRNTLISQGLAAFVDGLLLQPFHDEDNRPPEWLTKPGNPDDPDAINLPSTSIDPKEIT